MWKTIGHEWAVELLQRALAEQRLAHTYLLTGPAHTGKATLAEEVAAALNCTGEMPPCGRCRACLKTAQHAHPDVLFVAPQEGKLKIDQVRAAQRELALSPYEGRWRVCVITDFQLATVEAANALLKTLEEPPSRVVLILTATDASLLLPTIISRCQVLALRAVPAAQIARMLVERGQSEAQALLLARLAAGRIGWAIQAAQDATVLEQRRARLDELGQVLQSGRAARIQAAERLAKERDLSEIIGLWQVWWRDALLLNGGCEELLVNTDALEALRQLTLQVDLAQAQAALRGGEAALRQLEQNVNGRLVLEVLFLSWPYAAARAA
jgi:DNA polymerase-3 subunit delta'